MTHSVKADWPRDLKIFAAGCALWSGSIVIRLLAHETLSYPAPDPVQAVLGGIKFYGGVAQLVLLAQAFIFMTCALGIVRERRWGIVLALVYFAQIVMSHLIFILAYMYDLRETEYVRVAALEGPVPTLILLYLWMQSRDLLFANAKESDAAPRARSEI